MLISVKKDVATIVWMEYVFSESLFTKSVYFYIFTFKKNRQCGRRSALHFKAYQIIFFHAYKPNSGECFFLMEAPGK